MAYLNDKKILTILKPSYLNVDDDVVSFMTNEYNKSQDPEIGEIVHINQLEAVESSLATTEGKATTNASNIAKIVDGTTTVGKANRDSDGNIIKDIYQTKAEASAIGQQYLHTQCQYNATATSSLGVGWVFNIDTELVNNTEHKFIATIDELSHQNTFIRVASGGVEIPVIATFEDGEEQQPYFRSGDHRKFIYAISNDLSIIMFSAFYTNGQFIIVEPNDIDYAREIDIDEIRDGVTVVGKARADENGNNIANTYATKVELTNGIDTAKSYTESYTDFNCMPKSMTTTDFDYLWNRG